jgi:hypothetical protein
MYTNHMQVLNVLVQLMMKCATTVTFSKFDLCDLEGQINQNPCIMYVKNT